MNPGVGVPVGPVETAVEVNVAGGMKGTRVAVMVLVGTADICVTDAVGVKVGDEVPTGVRVAVETSVEMPVGVGVKPAGAGAVIKCLHPQQTKGIQLAQRRKYSFFGLILLLEMPMFLALSSNRFISRKSF